MGANNLGRRRHQCGEKVPGRGGRARSPRGRCHERSQIAWSHGRRQRGIELENIEFVPEMFDHSGYMGREKLLLPTETQRFDAMRASPHPADQEALFPTGVSALVLLVCRLPGRLGRERVAGGHAARCCHQRGRAPLWRLPGSRFLRKPDGSPLPGMVTSEIAGRLLQRVGPTLSAAGRNGRD